MIYQASTSSTNRTLHAAPLPAESDVESVADPVADEKAASVEAQADEEMKDASENPAEEEEDGEEEDDDDNEEEL